MARLCIVKMLSRQGRKDVKMFASAQLWPVLPAGQSDPPAARRRPADGHPGQAVLLHPPGPGGTPPKVQGHIWRIYTIPSGGFITSYGDLSCVYSARFTVVSY